MERSGTGSISKGTISEVRQRIEIPLANARGSDQSRDREGAVRQRIGKPLANARGTIGAVTVRER